MEIVVDHCPICDATTVTDGALRIAAGHAATHLGMRFEPEGMRFFSFRWKRGVLVSKGFCCCLACGHLLTSLPAEQLRAYMKAHGDSVARQAVEPFEKKVVDPEFFSLVA